jgi:hypothetical protein|tara:strand:- start:670 stop:1116 length:447 start_codon:yes stop_codon:yes gene_type:complete
MKEKVLFHGSPYKLKGSVLKPSQGDDSKERPENSLFGVYASDRKDFAIAMAILSCKGVIGGSIEGFTKTSINAKIYGPLPKKKFIYLYSLPANTFRPTKSIAHQYISSVPVKALLVEKLAISDHVRLLKKATKDETKKWLAKYGASKK